MESLYEVSNGDSPFSGLGAYPAETSLIKLLFV